MFALLLLCAFSERPSAVVDHVDLVEINHVHNPDGQHVLDQVIFYDWSASKRRYEVRTWRKLTSCDQIPLYHWRRRCYVMRWYDGSTLREVAARATCETWTRFDPELQQRDVLPVEQRRPLRAPRGSW